MPTIRALFIHAHFDDYEFNSAGLFEMWKQHLGNDFEAQVIICTDGKAGHQFRTRDETGAMRLAEMQASAKIGQIDFRQLHYPNGEIPREACLQVDKELLAALWKAIRDFEPDYLICPPVMQDPLAGIHIDHIAVAEAVRKVAYMINVPHAFTPEYPADETQPISCRVPIILNCYDPYMKTDNTADIYVDVSAAFDKICEMSYCHQSQIVEWLPWVSGLATQHVPRSLSAWSEVMRHRFAKRNQGRVPDARIPHEIFTLTAWGTVPSIKQLKKDLPPFLFDEQTLEAQLAQWSAG